MSACRREQNEALEIAAHKYIESGSPEAKEVVVMAAEALVTYYAALYSPGKIDEDLKQSAYEGLLKALKRFDPTKRVMFSTYAAHCIIGEIRHDLRDRNIFKVPEYMKNLQTKIINATEELAQKNGSMPSLKEIAEEVNVTEAGIVEAMQIGCVSLDEVDLLKVKHLRYDHFKLPIEEKIAIQMALEKLNKLHQRLIKLIFFEGLTQEQTAKRLGLNQRKVSRLLNHVLTKMRTFMT